MFSSDNSKATYTVDGAWIVIIYNLSLEEGSSESPLHGTLSTPASLQRRGGNGNCVGLQAQDHLKMLNGRRFRFKSLFVNNFGVGKKGAYTRVLIKMMKKVQLPQSPLEHTPSFPHSPSIPSLLWKNGKLQNFNYGSYGGM